MKILVLKGKGENNMIPITVFLSLYFGLPSSKLEFLEGCVAFGKVWRAVFSVTVAEKLLSLLSRFQRPLF